MTNFLARGIFAPTGSLLPPQRLSAISILIAASISAWLIEPLYFENQHTKFLHAFADVGFGFLRDDWLTQTKDGLRPFTSIVRFIFLNVGEMGFYAATLFFYTLFGVAMVTIFLFVSTSKEYVKSFATLLLFSSIISIMQPIDSLRNALLNGLGGQYIIGGAFQPSDFGVLLVFSIIFFAHGKIILSILSIIVASYIHPGYIAPSAILSVIYIIRFLVESLGAHLMNSEDSIRLMQRLLPPTIGLLVLLLMALETRNAFPPTSPEIQIYAHQILTDIRIPHHTDPTNWSLYKSAARLAVCLAALWVLSPGRLRFIIAASLCSVIVCVGIALLPNTHTFRLVAPWRLSVALMPISVTVCIAYAAISIGKLSSGSSVLTGRLPLASLVVICFSIAGGLATKFIEFNRPTEPYIGYIRSTLKEGQTYLTPTTRMSFRLSTGAPQFVTTKSHPYQDIEVIEWFRRVRLADKFYNSETVDCNAVKAFRDQERITHVLLDAASKYICAFGRTVFEKDGIQIVDISEPPPLPSTSLR